MKKGEKLEDFAHWANKNEIIFEIENGFIAKGIVKESSQKNMYGWEKTSKKREYIPKDQQPEKPKGKGKMVLDHKKPLWKGGDDNKENLKWVPEEQHKEKTKQEGSYAEGGDKKQRHLKNDGDFTKYQKDCGKERQKQLFVT